MTIKEWNGKITKLRTMILKPEKFKEAISLCLELHAMVHSKEVSGSKIKTFEDEIWENLDENTFRTAINKKGRTIAYGIWHSTRIEDMTMNILVAGKKQVIDSGNWINKMNASAYDTGNAMTAKDILQFSAELKMKELKKYRIAVGKKTIEIIKSLKPEDMKRKVDKEKLKHILDIGAVLDVKESNWLIDFWGRKNIAGILLMPATRHLLVHINESLSAKKHK
jgi:hypothetical protein